MPFSMSYKVSEPIPAKATTPITARAKVRRHIPKLRDSPPLSEMKTDLIPPAGAGTFCALRMDTPDDGAALLAQAEVEGGAIRKEEVPT